MKKLLLIPLLVLVACTDPIQRTGLYETMYVSFEGADMPVFLRGQRNAKSILVMVHGGPGGNGLEYRFGSYSDKLEEELLVAYWDQRGQGVSLGKYGSEILNVEQMARDLEAVVRALRVRFPEDVSIFILGHSWGGMLGTQFMVNEERQKLVNGWIEANGAHNIELLNKSSIELFKQVAQEQIAAGNSVEKWEEIQEWADGIDTDNISTEDGDEINQRGFEVEDYLSEDGVLTQDEQVGQGDLKLLLNSPMNAVKSFFSGNSTSNYLYNEVETTNLSPKLSAITLPCLFLYSKYDFVVPAALGLDAYEKVSSVQKKLVIFEFSGHSPMSNEPERFCKEVLDFIAENE